jgi:aryl-alcohol dehydrogenase-like predicted oxidoreductase
MEKRILGKTGFSISVFAFGGIVVRDTEQTEADGIVAEAVDRGVNYFDVAPSYGNSQNILGPALKPHRRKVYLACKTQERTKDAALEELHTSLKLLHTDYFDVYQMHAVRPEEIDAILGPGGALEAFVQAKEQGLVRYIGITTHFDEAALRLLDSYDFDTLLFPVNWACYLKDGLGKAALEAAAARNMGRIAIKGLADRAKEPREDGYPQCWYRPLFDDPELADLALRFTLQQDVHTALSPGDARMLRLGFSIMDKYQGNPPPLNSEELVELKRRALLVRNPIFPH